MSGSFGWHGGSRSNSYRDNDRDYSSARSAYTPPANRVTRVTPKPTPTKAKSTPQAPVWKEKQAVTPGVPTAKHSLKSTAENVIIVVSDLTGSMEEWPKEIFKRLPLMFGEVQGYLGQDLEFLFIAHHDAHADRDRTSTTQVTRFGRGPELDGLLASFDMPGRTGGGQGYESHELVAYYLLHQVDTSSARNVYCFFITDEVPFDQVKSDLVRDELGLSGGGENSVDVFRALQQKMNVFTVLRRTTSYPTKIRKFEEWWANALGKDKVLKLNDHRRAVDVMLGSMAAHTGQKEKFTQALQTRQGPTRHGDQNIQTVLNSIAFVGPSGPETEQISNTTKGLLD